MAPELYTTDISPPARAIYITEKSLGIKLNRKVLDLSKNDHLKPDFIKLNPKHTIPILVDGDLVLTDSHAITAYLVNQYGQNESLYPKDAKKRALVDQMLHFDSSVAFASLLNCCGSIRLKLASEVTPEMASKIETMYSFLNQFLNDKKWVATDSVTIADFHLATTIAAADYFVSFKNFPNICNWIKNMESLSYYKETEFGLAAFKTFFNDILEK